MIETPKREIYLDNSATTKVCEKALEVCLQTMKIDYGNPSSLHSKGFEAEKIINRARKIIAQEIKCNDSEIYFTSGATESNNLAFFGTVSAKKRNGNKIVISAVEHSSIISCVGMLEKNGYEIVKINPDENGNFSVKDFYNAVDEKTVLVSAMLVNNEVGTILPVMEIGRAVKKKNPKVVFHVDAVQGFVKVPLKLKNSPIDLLSASGHKIYAPKGVGLLYVKKGTKITPLIYGGSQESGIRPGTQSVPLIAAFGAAVEFLSINAKKYHQHYKILKQYLYSKIKNIDDITINSPENSVDYLVNISVKGIRSEIMLHFLEKYNIFISSGSACAKGAKSHVLEAMGLPPQRIDTAMRISFSYETTTEDIDEIVDKITLAINTLMKTK